MSDRSFSKLDKYVQETFEIDADEVIGCPEQVEKLISLEKETPLGLLEACYAGLVRTITAHGFPSTPTNEAKRSTLLHFLPWKAGQREHGPFVARHVRRNASCHRV